MKIRTVFLGILFLLLSLPAVASVELHATHITTDDGVANNSIRSVYQDSKGFIWMGTLNGLSRYDGNTFVTYRPEGGNRISLADHRIWGLEEDKNGLLWIFTQADLISCFDLQQERFVDFTGCGEYKQPYSQRMTDHAGNVWLYHKGNGCRKVSYREGAFSSVVFKKELKNLPSNRVSYIYEDKHHRIWIGTDRGVVRVEGERSETILHNHNAARIEAVGDDLYFLSWTGEIALQRGDEEGRVIYRLSDNGLGKNLYGAMRLEEDWVIFTELGGYLFNFSTHSIGRDSRFNIAKGEVQQDNRGNFWIHNQTGVVRYVNAKSREMKSFRLMPADKVNYIDQERYRMVHDSRDILWITTYGNGLFAYNLATEELQHFKSDIGRFRHIASDFLQYIMEDSAGDLWVSSEYTGISHLSILNEGADRIFPEEESYTDRSNAIRMIKRMEDGNIWLGTRRGGLYCYDATLSNIERDRHFDSNIYAMEEGADGSIWLGSRGQGLNIDGRWYRYNAQDSTSISNNNIFAIHRDNKERMWVGTFGGGLDLATKTGQGYTFRHFLDGSNKEREIRAIEEDSHGHLWVGTSAGLYLFHPDSLLADPTAYRVYNTNNGRLRSNEIKCILHDSQGRIWVGASGKGFSLCTPGGGYDNLTFDHYDSSDGLVNNMVQSIVEDNEGRFWIATEYGISRFDPVRRAFENFFFSSSALGNVYSENSFSVSEEGKLLFGTNHGLVVIDPSKFIRYAVDVPLPTFTNLHINGSTMRPGDKDSPLQRSLTYTDALKLKYDQNSVVIDFSIFDYSETNTTKYSYRLDNYDKAWSVPSSLNFAAYKNLPPGSYRLRVKARNRMGIWSNEEAVLKLTITPPFWKTTWAFLLYTLLLGAALYVAFRLIKKFNALNNRIEIEKQLTEYKLVFFTNISHEFRTPLTLIQGALEKIQRRGKAPKEMGDSLKVMEKSTRRMLRLINQLLEFRKMQNNKLALALEETDVVAFLYEIFLSFNDAAESQQMEFRFLPSMPAYKMFIDKGYLDKITYNLLSNAFKYTPKGGCVSLSVEVEEATRQLVITVTDTGVGIPKEKQHELFKRFMQSSFSGSSVGVGLHLSHELVQVHKGSITYRENEGGGSIFTVCLPTDRSVYEEKDFLIPHNALLEEQQPHTAENATPENEEEEALARPTAPLNRRKVLIIEDDNDVRKFLTEEVGQYFEVESEADGTSGLERARTYDADLIICDVLMPGLTGFELTRKLKNDFDTSHIPIILLTALSAPENHLEAVQCGADAFITKPFSLDLLLARAFKLIEQREKLREKFSHDPNMIRPAICTSDKDKEFADKLQRIMEQQIGNAEFTIDEFASMMGLGRTVFYRKTRGVTGYAPNEYIRIVRMKKAAELLRENRYKVAEVSYQVGINDPFYFSKCFKRQFGVSPSAYLRGMEEQSEPTEQTAPTEPSEAPLEAQNDAEMHTSA